MKSLRTLVRLHDWRLEERRREQNELLRLADRLRGQLAQLEADLADEQRIAAAAPERALGYDRFAAAVIARRRTIVKSLQEIEARAHQAAEAVAEAFGELKRHEVLLARREAAQRQERERRQQLALDELGIEMFRRQRAG